MNILKEIAVTFLQVIGGIIAIIIILGFILGLLAAVVENGQVASNY